MSFYISSGIYSFIANLIIGLFVFSCNPRKTANIYFALFSLTVSGWSVGSFFVNIIQDKTAALWVLRFNYLFAMWLPSVYIHFIYALTENYPKFAKAKLTLSYAASVFLSFAVFTPWFIPKLRLIGNTDFYISFPGPLYYLFFVFFSLGMLEVLSHTTFRLQHYKVPKRTQIKYMTIANAIAILGGFEYFSRVLGFFHSPPLDDYILVAYLMVVAYAIVRHQLLDIEVIVKRTLVFAGLFVMVMGVVMFITTMTQHIIGKYIQLDTPFSMMFSGLIITLLYDPTRKFLTNATDKYLFQKKFKLSSIVAQASQAIAFVQSLKWLARRIVAFLVTKCRIKHAVVYIRNDQHQQFMRGAIRGYLRHEFPPTRFPEDHFMVRYLYDTRRPIELLHLEEQLQKHQDNAMSRAGIQMVVDFMKTCKAEVIIPSFLRRRIDTPGIGKEKDTTIIKDEIILRNILILGGKKSDDSYTEEDLDVFYSLAQESAIAIENARLYDEAVKRTRQLQSMNRELEETNERLQVTQASLIVAEKNATMVGMAQAIGHEVNNPLTTIMMRVEMIQRERIKKLKDFLSLLFPGATPEHVAKGEKIVKEFEDDINRAAKAAHRINAVVHTLTDILRDTKGEMGALSLKVLCHEAIQATRFSTYEENLAGCEFKLEVMANLMIQGNLEQLLQVFINLIKNAFEAMENTKNRRIVIWADLDADDSKMAIVKITDNGPGIPPDVLPRIWGQGFSTKMRKDQSIGAAGQGQGLFVCKHMIESVHRGHIYCLSEVGKGTTFVIRLPLADIETESHV